MIYSEEKSAGLAVPLIAILPLQHPIIWAKALATMDWLSSGRPRITSAT